MGAVRHRPPKTDELLLFRLQGLLDVDLCELVFLVAAEQLVIGAPILEVSFHLLYFVFQVGLHPPRNSPSLSVTTLLSGRDAVCAFEFRLLGGDRGQDFFRLSHSLLRRNARIFQKPGLRHRVVRYLRSAHGRCLLVPQLFFILG